MSTTRKVKLSFLAITAIVLMVSFTLVNCGGGAGEAERQQACTRTLLT